MNKETMMRSDGRADGEIRRMEFQPGFTQNPAGSVLVRAGNTMILCTCTVESGIPRFRPEDSGWMTAEYAMTPGSTHDRMRRERRGAKGRTREIERLIGRSLRACVDLSALGDHTVHIDCEVLQADGGTRTASISGGFVALALACESMLREGLIERSPITGSLAAISCGVVGGDLLVDLPYEEDSAAEVDMNVVLLNADSIVEVQATGEQSTMSDEQLLQLVRMSRAAIVDITAMQRDAVGHDAWTRLGLDA